MAWWAGTVTLSSRNTGQGREKDEQLTRSAGRRQLFDASVRPRFCDSMLGQLPSKAALREGNGSCWRSRRGWAASAPHALPGRPEQAADLAITVRDAIASSGRRLRNRLH